LRLRSELTDVFTHGDYQPLEVSGQHADHVIAFARRYGRHAGIILIGRLFAPFTQGGRAWPTFETLDATANLKDYSIAGHEDHELRLSQAFRALPAIVLKARVASGAKAVRQRMRA